jgi:hypothetical protein
MTAPGVDVGHLHGREGPVRVPSLIEDARVLLDHGATADTVPIQRPEEVHVGAFIAD